MQAFQKILFPVDLSESCRAAAPHVAAMTAKYHADLTLLHVLEMPAAYFSDWYGSMSLIDLPAVRNSRINELETFAAGQFQGLDVDALVIEGEPASVITNYASREGTDLIMMSTHGHGVFRGLLLSSVTAKVLHDVACPVWTGVHMESAPPPSQAFANIMCAVDLNETSIGTIQFGNRVAQDFGAKLWLVHAVPAAETRPQKYFETDLLRYLEQEARETLGTMLATAGVRAQICLGSGDVARAVRESALSHAADLVIIGRGHATRTLGKLRTHVYSIIRESPCPVISV